MHILEMTVYLKNFAYFVEKFVKMSFSFYILIIFMNINTILYKNKKIIKIIYKSIYKGENFFLNICIAYIYIDHDVWQQLCPT